MKRKATINSFYDAIIRAKENSALSALEKLNEIIVERFQDALKQRDIAQARRKFALMQDLGLAKVEHWSDLGLCSLDANDHASFSTLLREMSTVLWDLREIPALMQLHFRRTSLLGLAVQKTLSTARMPNCSGR